MLVIAPLLGIVLDRAIMRHLQGKELVVQLMVTVGLMFAFIGLANMIWNQNAVTRSRSCSARAGSTSRDVTAHLGTA